MKDNHPHTNLEGLLQHSDWLTALARQLVADSATADDLVQDTWVAALRNPPDPKRPAQPWLAGVVRRLASLHRRRLARRLDLAPAGSPPAAGEVAERVEQEQGLARIVLELEQPYRDTVLLRYYEGLSAARIAQMTGVPAATVRIRLKRGLEKLRMRLDEQSGGRREWARALGPVAGWSAPHGTGGATILGGLIMGKVTVVTAIAAALALLVWVGIDSTGGIEPAGSSDLSKLGEVVRSRSVELPEVGSAEVGDRTPVAQDRAASKPQASAPVTTDGEILGRVLLVDDAGQQLEGLDGTIELIAWQGDLVRTHEVVEVANSTFNVPTGGVDCWTAHVLHLEGHAAVLDDKDTGYLPEAGPFEVRAHLARVTQLKVLSELTREQLSDVTVYLANEMEELNPVGPNQHPGAALDVEALVVNGQSPVALRQDEIGYKYAINTCLVGSPGFAWKAIELDLSASGDREVRLEPGGSLEVSLSGDAAPSGALLRIRRVDPPERWPYTELPVGTDRGLAVDGLPLGAYLVSIEVGKWYRDPLVLAQDEVNVTEAGTALLSLQIEPVDEPMLAPLRGRLVVPSEWELSSFSLAAKPRWASLGPELERLVPGSTGLKESIPGSAWEFDFGEVPTGEYELAFRGNRQGLNTAAYLRFELVAGGLPDLSLELPPVADVVMHVLDSSTNEAVEDLSLTWQVQAGEDLEVMVWIHGQTDPGVYKIIAPVGEVRLRASCNGRSSLDETLTIQPGHNELTRRLDPACLLGIVFLDGETTVPPPTSWSPNPKHLDGAGKLLYGRPSGGRFATALSEPGTYVFQVPEFEGFLPVPDQTITVSREEETVHEVRLVREP